jgi:DNA-binding PadR family transcriptional regulator
MDADPTSKISGERLEIQQGSFYTAIYRLERQGWINGEWRVYRRTIAAHAFIR